MKKNIRNVQTKILSNDWSVLKKLTYEYKRDDGIWEKQVREVYDRGNGATILLYNSIKKTVLLTRQFRIPTYLNGNGDGQLIETCAGKLDDENPDDCIVREVLEETGYRVPIVTKVFEVYMSPGSVSEIIHFYVAPYDESMRESQGGGLTAEQENIQVLEIGFEKAFSMIASGEIRDAKTIMLLQHAKIQHLV
jgi:nudix-type nucleoside diphosphatase (YffH/AdpP family)